MKPDPIRKTFPELLSKAFSLGYKAYIPGESELGHAMMGALYEVLHWLHKEYRVYMVVNPIPNVVPLKFAAVVYLPAGETVTAKYQHQNPPVYQDWIEAHVEALRVCLEYVALKQITADDY